MLTHERIARLIQQADRLAPKEGNVFRTLVRLTEAEVRKQDDALIQQMLEAIEAETSDTWECNSYHPKLYDAVVAARARLGEKT